VQDGFRSLSLSLARAQLGCIVAGIGASVLATFRCPCSKEGDHASCPALSYPNMRSHKQMHLISHTENVKRDDHSLPFAEICGSLKSFLLRTLRHF
jgi:hypothetical protein